MADGLIYDVGVNDGSDSAYYLSRGSSVVGVEASPVMAEKVRARFAAEITAGAFTLLNVGIADTEGQLEFWLSDFHEWSSFDRAIASRNGTPCRPVMVETIRFDTLIARYGVPFFCKIDIEGHERSCLRALNRATAPRYISIEMSHTDAGEDIELLRGLGYSRFKIVSQRTRTQSFLPLAELSYALPSAASNLVRRATRKFLGVTQVGDWRFSSNSSGPFAEDTPGSWKSYDAAMHIWRKLKQFDERAKSQGLGDWFDIHAKL